MKKTIPHTVPETVSQTLNRKINKMIKEYLVVGRYIAQIPESKDITEFILTQLEVDLTDIKPEDIKGFINSFFSVVEGDVVEVDDDGEEI